MTHPKCGSVHAITQLAQPISGPYIAFDSCSIQNFLTTSYNVSRCLTISVFIAFLVAAGRGAKVGHARPGRHSAGCGIWRDENTEF